MKTSNKRFILLLLAFISFLTSEKITAQTVVKEWDKTFGGDKTDNLQSLILPTTDGGYLVGGYSLSGTSGDKTQSGQGNSDYWVVKMDANGNKQWDKSFGGSNDDILNSLTATSDGGYLMGGYSSSGISGDKTQASKGGNDYWVVKIDGSGTKVWDKTFGGTSHDYLYSLTTTNDGGFLLGGRSSSGISGDKTQASKGGFDYWVVKIDNSGSKQWEKTFGGSSVENLYSVTATSDGGYLLGGFSYSGQSGDKTQASKGGWDYWVVKINSSGSKVWDKAFGGNSADHLYSVTTTTDGGFLLGGFSLSDNSGDKSQASKGGWDYWVIKINSSGTKVWDKTIGGSSDDFLYSISNAPDGTYLLGGYSYSDISDDKTELTQGLSDYWVVKLDATGNKQWDKTMGGNDEDFLYSLTATNDGGFLLGGYSYSQASGNKTQSSQGDEDFWVVKLNTIKTFYRDNDNDTYGNEGITASGIYAPAGFVSRSGDWNDNNNTLFPGAPELCDNLDNNGDGQIDEGALRAFYQDYDRDGFGNNSTVVMACSSPSGYVTVGGDCYDTKSTVYPGAPELADNLDNDCDGSVDEGLTLNTYYQDYDRDGYGNSSAIVMASISPGAGYVLVGGDCNDKKNTINPGATEVAGNGVDDNCNGQVDEVASVAVQNIAAEEAMTESHIKVNAAPNPSIGHFTLNIQGKNNLPVQVRVMNLLGSLVEQKREIAPNSTLQIGQNYQAGVYFVEVTQGMEKEVLKLIKHK